MAREFFSETQKLQRVWLWIISLDLIVVGMILTYVFSKSRHRVLLELKTGEHILIGIQNKEGVEMAMNRLMRIPFDN